MFGYFIYVLCKFSLQCDLRQVLRDHLTPEIPTHPPRVACVIIPASFLAVIKKSLVIEKYIANYLAMLFLLFLVFVCHDR